MKEAMLGMMAAMMPYMMPLVWLGGGLAVAGLVLLIVGLVVGRRSVVQRGTTWAGLLTFLLGAFFVISQFMGMWLGARPFINFADSRQYQFVLVPFWQVGLALLVPGIILWWFGRRA
jgi:hypothetical protein